MKIASEHGADLSNFSVEALLHTREVYRGLHLGVDLLWKSMFDLGKGTSQATQ
jgi:hypothetical protein